MPIMTTLRPGTAARSSGTRRSSARDIAAESDSKTSGAAAVTCYVTCDAKAEAPTTSMLLFFLRIRVRASRSSLFSARMKTRTFSTATVITSSRSTHGPPRRFRRNKTTLVWLTKDTRVVRKCKQKFFVSIITNQEPGRTRLKMWLGHSHTTFKNRTELLERELFW